MPAGTMGLRTIWISLRAVNYTAMVFKNVIRDTQLLSKEEKLLTKQTMMAGQHALSAGLMWTVLGQSIDDTMSKNIAHIGVINQLVGIMKPYIGALLTIGGIIQMLVGIEKIYVAIKSSTIIATYLHKTAIQGLTIQYWQLAVAISAAFGGFIMAYSILSAIKGPAGIAIAAIVAVTAAVIALWVATSALSGGTKLIFDLAAIGVATGAGAAILGNVGNFATGTRMVGATGSAVVHRGEVIYNPATNRPTQVGNDLNQGGPSTTVFEMPVTIKEINTKADIDDVDEVLRKGLHKVARSVRG